MDIKEVYINEAESVKKQLVAFDWSDPNKYADWLAQTYFFVLHSTRLLTLSASRCPTDNQELHYRFVKHTAEESRHERMLLNDLKALGRDISEFTEYPTTASFFQTQYYQIEHIGAVTFFGYILVLEGLAVEAGDYIYDQVQKHHGPQKGSFLKVHSSEDPDHLRKAFLEIEKMSLIESIKICQNMKNSFFNYANILSSINHLNQVKKSA